MDKGKKIVVFTDLDGTLLDPVTYSWGPAAEAINLLREMDASLVLVSSKTFAEMVSFHSMLGFKDPFIVENGGGIIFGLGASIDMSDLAIESRPITIGREGHIMLPLGLPRATLLSFLMEIAESGDIVIRSYFEMKVEEISELTNLSEEEVSKSLDRHFDIPFVVLDSVLANEQRVTFSAKSRGLNVVRGGRFLHLIGHHGKGYAVDLLLKGYRRKHSDIATIGLGDAPNDFPFLQLVDQPVLLGCLGEPGFLHEDIPKHTLKTGERGPMAWNVAIRALLSSRKEQQT